MQIKSISKFILTSPKKLREVAFLVKGFSALEAINRLPFVKKDAAGVLQKALTTAVANARQKGFSDSALSIKEIQINEGPRMKRFRAGSRGRAKPYKKRMSHIRIILEVLEVKSIEKSQGDMAKDDAGSKNVAKEQTDKKSVKMNLGSLLGSRFKKKK